MTTIVDERRVLDYFEPEGGGFRGLFEPVNGPDTYETLMSAEIDHALVPRRGRHEDAVYDLRLELYTASSDRTNTVGQERTIVEMPVAFHLDDEAGTVTLTGRAGGHDYAVLAILEPDPDAAWLDTLSQYEVLGVELSYETALYGDEDADEAALAEAREAFVAYVEQWNARHDADYDPHATYF